MERQGVYIEGSNYYKLTGLVDEIPQGINLDAYPLHKKRIYYSYDNPQHNGRLWKVQHYLNYEFTADTYSDLAVEEEYLYTDVTMGNTQFLINRTLTVNFYLDNNEIGTTQVKSKYFTIPESIKEGKVRREYLIEEVGVPYLLSVIGEVNGIGLYNILYNGIMAYKGVNNQTYLFSLINNCNEPYLTPQIKGTLIALLSYN